MSLFKVFLPRILIVLVVCAVASVGFLSGNIAKTDAKYSSVNKIILDAGHGGFDGGAVASDGTVEKNINLQIVRKMREFLRFFGCEVILTREADVGTEDNQEASIAARKKSDLTNRLFIMEHNPDAVFVSIHLNKFTTSAASGAQVFYTPNFPAAKILGENIQSSIVSSLQPQNNRVVKQGYSSTFLLKNARVPAVLVECGFLSNTAELQRLKTDEYQSQMAFSIAMGILKYFEGEDYGSENKNGLYLQ